MKRVYLYSLIILVYTFPALHAQTRGLAKTIDSIMHQPDSLGPFNGSVMIWKGKRKVYAIHQGYSDLQTNRRIKENTRFIIGSVSKQITAVLVLREYDKGTIGLNIPIKKYLPELTQPWADTVTIHHLLSHTHGIVALDRPLMFSPGTAFSYSQIGFELLARILEKVTKKSFARLSQKLFKDCGMRNSFHPDNLKDKKKQKIKGYTRNASTHRLELDSNSWENYVAAGGFVSTVNDLVAWNWNLHHNKLLKKSTYALMMSKQPHAIRQHPLFGPTAYGYGITVADSGALLQLGQTGYAPGFLSMNFYFPASQLNVVICCNVVNHDGHDPAALRAAFHYHIAILDAVKKSM